VALIPYPPPGNRLDEGGAGVETDIAIGNGIGIRDRKVVVGEGAMHIVGTEGGAENAAEPYGWENTLPGLHRSKADERDGAGLCRAAYAEPVTDVSACKEPSDHCEIFDARGEKVHVDPRKVIRQGLRNIMAGMRAGLPSDGRYRGAANEGSEGSGHSIAPVIIIGHEVLPRVRR
jgi:hypothetical protein